MYADLCSFLILKEGNRGSKFESDNIVVSLRFRRVLCALTVFVLLVIPTKGYGSVTIFKILQLRVQLISNSAS